MFACLLTLLLLFPVIFATIAIEELLTSDELTEMGLRLKKSHA